MAIQDINNIAKSDLNGLQLFEELFLKTRNTLSLEKLEKLSIFASSIQEPLLFGTYEDDLHYIKTLKLMLNSTLETRLRGIFFLKKILPLLDCKERMLDVGPGDGELTCWVGNKFNHVVAIDTNKEAIDALNKDKRILHKKISLEKINASILEISLSEGCYNLGILSHVLYYIDRKRWFDVVNVVYRSLAKNGLLVVALSGDGFGKAELIKYFGGSIIDIDGIAEECVCQYGMENVKMFAIEASIYAKHLKTMRHIAGFFLADAEMTAHKSELSDYLLRVCPKSGDVFKMTSQQKFIVVSKE